MQEERSNTLERVLLAAAAVFFLLRFLFPGDTVYILDEAFMQLRLDEHFAAGTIPFSNSRGSSIPLPYGPGALWFFMVARLFTWHPVGIVLWHLCFQMLGYAFFTITVRRAYGREAGAWCALLAATSPLLFFFSRHPWDSTLFIWMGAILLYLLDRLRAGGREYPIHFALGLVGAYAVNCHLMFGPVFVALAATLVLHNLRLHSLRSARAWKLLFTFALATLLVLAPYLVEAARIMAAEHPFQHERATHHWGDGRNLWWIFLRTTIFSSIFKARIMVDDGGVRDHFFAFTGPVLAFFYRIDIFGWVPKLAAWGAAIATLARLARLRFSDDPLRVFAALSFLFLVVIFQYLNIPMASHYFLPIWWFVFLGIGLAIQQLRFLWRRIFLVFVAGSTLVNASYVLFALAYLHENKGARNMEASVAVHEQLRNLRELCAWAANAHRSEVKVYKEEGTSLGEPAFDFLPAHMPECRGVKVTLVTDRTAADFVLHHPKDSATSAALVADPRL